MAERVLAIKLGALGDLTLCMGAFSALRKKYPAARIALLTGAGFADFARQMPWFDEVLIDPRPKAIDLQGWFSLIRAVRTFAPTHVFDFQGKFRQSLLFFALGGPLLGPAWSGAALFCAHPRLWPPENGMHYTDFLAAQLERAGVEMDRAPDLSWLDAPLDGFDLPARFALLIPGCAPTRLYKRWPPERYAALAKKLAEGGMASLAVGTKADAQSIAAIRQIAPAVIDLGGKTTLKELAALARRAEIVVGNDTGPSHIAAAVGARVLTLFADQVDPVWSCPRGPRAQCLQGHPLAELSVEEVLKTLNAAPFRQAF